MFVKVTNEGPVKANEKPEKRNKGGFVPVKNNQ